MGASNSNNKNMKFYSLKAKADETNKPYFQLSEKVGEAYQKTEQFDTMAGSIKSAAIEEFDYQGAKTKVFVLMFEDDNETSKVSLSHSKLSYSIFNSIASDTAYINNYTIQVYKKQDKTTKKWWAAAAVKINDQRAEWAVDPRDTPKSEPIMGKDGKPLMKAGKPLYDDEPVKEYWEQFFKDRIMAPFNAAAKSGGTGSKPVPATSGSQSNEDFLADMNKPVETANDELPDF